MTNPLCRSDLIEAFTSPNEDVKAYKKENTFKQFTGKILLVEDNILNQEVAKEILKEAGIQVDIASDGDEALAIMQEVPAHTYDLILMDIQMPRMDGYTVTKKIRSLPNKENANIPILALTANAYEEDKNQSIEAGMNGYISKPIQIQELFQALQKIL